MVFCQRKSVPKAKFFWPIYSLAEVKHYGRLTQEIEFCNKDASMKSDVTLIRFLFELY